MTFNLDKTTFTSLCRIGVNEGKLALTSEEIEPRRVWYDDLGNQRISTIKHNELSESPYFFSIGYKP